jgi:hypothetical protein
LIDQSVDSGLGSSINTCPSDLPTWETLPQPLESDTEDITAPKKVKKAKKATLPSQKPLKSSKPVFLGVFPPPLPIVWKKRLSR